ncbi:hypothetical protein [Acanthopleuribacter pedis]|uniref:Uncharacterized protein n=1 Tax=Acanthopleuribacter pedis TaxID=442870 RepID=A0A8J7QDI5_9BACT|nr:hypothetical protein [Acanthopleuribacter pedis]MBO1321784.1 hypothetical protein [Acanthopleuribacter pedis]
MNDWERIPMGYTAKQQPATADLLNTGEWRFPNVPATLSSCVVDSFCDYVSAWNHNGFWLFDHPQILLKTAAHFGVDTTDMRLFYAEAYPRQYSAAGEDLGAVRPDPGLPTAVQEPTHKTLLGFEPVTFYAGTLPECAYLSCNGLYKDFPNLNQHLLFPDLDTPRVHLQNGDFSHCEPGPVRLIALYEVPWPDQSAESD